MPGRSSCTWVTTGSAASSARPRCWPPPRTDARGCPVSSLARSIEDGLLLPADIVGEDLVRAMSATPAEEYVLVEGDGSILGVLATADVDRAFEEGARK